MAAALLWFLVVEGLGVLTVPIGFWLFRRLPDRGYAFLKPLALLLVGFAVWLIGTVRLLPNGRGTTFLVVIGLAVVSLLVLNRVRADLFAYLHRHWPLWLFLDLVCLLGLSLCASLRAYVPDIAGTEQPMDFGFLNSSLRSTSFPPNDMWLSGNGISYYYFGYLILAQLIHLTGVDPAVGYNLALATVAGLAAAGVCGLVYNLISSRRREPDQGLSPVAGAYGLAAAALLLIVGNLQGALELARAHNLGSPAFYQSIGVNGALTTYPSTTWYGSEYYWWWHATRVINTLQSERAPNGEVLKVDDGRDYTISEFPFFSFLLGDLHPHVMALPFGLLALALILHWLLEERATTSWRAPPVLARVALVGLVIGALGFINSWDLPTYWLLLLGAVLARAWLDRRRIDRQWLGTSLGAAVPITAFALGPYLPFWLNLRSQANGIGVVSQYGSQPQHLFLIWGLLLFIAASFLLVYLRKASGGGGWRVALVSALVPAALFGLWLVAAPAAANLLGQRFDLGAVLARKLPAILGLGLLLGLALFTLLRTLRGPGRAPEPARLFGLGLLAAAGGLIFIPELFFLRDLFGNRMNTIFKLYYQAWLLLSVVGGYGLYYLGSALPRRGLGQVGTWAWRAGLAALVLAALAYPLAAPFNRTGNFSRNPTLDGLDFVAKDAPGEYAATVWLRDTAPANAVVLEAPGPDYSDFGRVASRTGVPTVLNWVGHEQQWRGDNRLFGDREADVDTIFRDFDRGQVVGLLKQYGVTHVYIGNRERERYGPTIRDRFDGWLPVAFEREGVTVFAVPPDLSAR